MSRRRLARSVARTAASGHVVLYRALRGRLVGRGPGGVPLLLLTTTGRVTGVPRTTPVGYAEHAGALLVSSAGSAATPAWLANLRATPQATVQVGDRLVPVVADEPADRSALWDAMVAARPIYRWARGSSRQPPPVVRLIPSPAGVPSAAALTHLNA